MSGIMTVHLRAQVPEALLCEVLAAWLGVDVAELAPLEEATPATRVPYQYTRRRRGFLTTLEVYAGKAPGSALASEIALAAHLARRLDMDALISPPSPAEDPYRWLLVRPSGATQEVREQPPDDEGDEDGIVLVEDPR